MTFVGDATMPKHVADATSSVFSADCIEADQRALDGTRILRFYHDRVLVLTRFVTEARED